MAATHVRRWLPAYLGLAAIWGCSFAFIKVGLTWLTPSGVVLGRLSLGLVTLAVLCAITRTPFPPRRTWGYVFIAAALMTAVPWTLFSFAETHISSALTGIINGATPLTTLVVILIAFPEEKPTLRRIIGLGLGFIGVLVVVGVWQPLGGGTVIGIVACLIAISMYGISYPFVRRYLTGGPTSAGLSPLSLAFGLLAFGVLQELVITAVTGGPVHGSPSWGAVLSIISLGCLGSGIAYVLNFTVIKNSDATTASTTTYVITLVAVVVGAVALGEPITWNEPVGALLVIVGAMTAQGLLGRRGRRPATSEVDLPVTGSAIED